MTDTAQRLGSKESDSEQVAGPAHSACLSITSPATRERRQLGLFEVRDVVSTVLGIAVQYFVRTREKEDRLARKRR